MRSFLQGFLLLLTAVLLAALPLFAPKAAANGSGRVWLNNAPAGPYEVSLFTLPSQPDLAPTHVSVLVTRSGQAKALEDVTILLTFSPPDGGEPQGPYLTSRANDPVAYFDANVALAQEGDWGVQITIRGLFGEGTASFMLPVRQRTVPWLALLVGFGPVLGLGTLLLFRRFVKAGRRTSSPSSEGDTS